MTLAQRITANRLIAEGFEISEHFDVIAVRGNDKRIIWADGSQHRATGAKR